MCKKKKKQVHRNTQSVVFDTATRSCQSRKSSKSIHFNITKMNQWIFPPTVAIHNFAANTVMKNCIGKHPTNTVSQWQKTTRVLTPAHSGYKEYLVKLPQYFDWRTVHKGNIVCYLKHSDECQKLSPQFNQNPGITVHVLLFSLHSQMTHLYGFTLFYHCLLIVTWPLVKTVLSRFISLCQIFHCSGKPLRRAEQSRRVSKAETLVQVGNYMSFTRSI